MQQDLVDVCDEHGELTGQTVTREVAHDKGIWHPVVLVWVYNSQGEVLLQHRSRERNAFVDTWDVSTSGHIRAGDSAIATAVHRLREDLGVHVRPSELQELGSVRDEFPLQNGDVHREYDVVYIVHRDVNLERMEFQTAEVNGARWMDLHDLAADMDNPETRPQYSARNPEVYRLALEAIWSLTTAAN